MKKQFVSNQCPSCCDNGVKRRHFLGYVGDKPFFQCMHCHYGRHLTVSKFFALSHLPKEQRGESKQK